MLILALFLHSEIEQQLYDALIFTCCRGSEPPYVSTSFRKKKQMQCHRPSNLVSRGKLFNRNVINKKITYLHLLKREDLHEILTLFHSSKFARSFRLKHTLERVHKSYHWLWNGGNATKFCNECEVYMVKKNYPRDASLQIMKFMLVTKPFTMVGLDVLGPLQTTINGHVFIVVATD